MALLNSYYQKLANELDKTLESKYGGNSLSAWWSEEYLGKEKYAKALSEGLCLCFGEAFARLGKYEASKKRAYRRFFKKKNFYFLLNAEKKAVIFAARAKDEKAPLRIPKRLGRYPVAGVCEAVLGYRYFDRLSRDLNDIKTQKRANRQKPAVFDMLSFSHISGCEKWAETVLRDESEEITVAPTVKALNAALLPHARVLRLPSTLSYLGILLAPCLEKIEVYECGTPSTVCEIQPHALAFCEALADLTLPKGTKHPSSELFKKNKKLQRLHIFEGMETFPSLSPDVKLKTLQIDGVAPKQLSLVCYNAQQATMDIGFYHCFFGNIDRLTVTGSAPKLQKTSFRPCDLTLPEGIESTDWDALSGQNTLAHVTLPSTLRSIGPRTFMGCALTELVIPDGVHTIESRAFADCEQLSRVQLPSALRVLNTNIFEGCTSLHELTLPDHITEISCQTATASEWYRFAKSEELILQDLRTLGKKEAVDPLLRMRLCYRENTPTAEAVAKYRETMRRNIEQNEEAIKAFLGATEALTVTHESIDHVTAAISYLSAVRPAGSPLLSALCKGLADFFATVTEKTAAEADFRYAGYFFDTVKRLKECGQKEAFDLLEPCRKDLYARIEASTVHATKGERLLAESNPKAREEALFELVRAYHIYPRNAPVLLGLIHFFASDPFLSDTKATDKLLDILKACQNDTDTKTDYIQMASDLISAVKRSADKGYHGFLTKQQKRELYFNDLHKADMLASVKMKAIPSDPSYYQEELKRPKRLSTMIDESFFADLRTEVQNRAVSSFGGDLETATYRQQARLDAIDAAEAVLFPKKRAALEKRLAERKAAEEAKRRAEEAERRRIEEQIAAAKQRPSYDDDDRYGYGKGYTPSPVFSGSDYSYSYNNPFDPVTQLHDWARAEAIGIEWDIIDRDYLLDIGVFGDHVL